MINNAQLCELRLKIEDMFKSDKNDPHYTNYKLMHSKYVSKIAIEIYKKECEMYKEKEDSNITTILELVGLLHDVGKISENTRGDDHAKASAIIAEKLLSSYNFTLEEKCQILIAITVHSYKTKKQMNSMDRISRIITEADLITKTLINDIFTWYGSMDNILENIDTIKAKQDKKFKQRKKLLSKSGKKVSDKIEKEFDQFTKSVDRQKKILNKGMIYNE